MLSPRFVIIRGCFSFIFMLWVVVLPFSAFGEVFLPVFLSRSGVLFGVRSLRFRPWVRRSAAVVFFLVVLVWLFSCRMSWTMVNQRRSGFRWDVFPFGGRNYRVLETGVTSFYVSEFPDYFNAKRIYELFGCAGNVKEVAISPRRNNAGKRFAFARFCDVEDGRLLAIRLDNILIEGRKIHVNLPRFDRSKKGGSGSSRTTSLIGQRRPVQHTAGMGAFVKSHLGGKSGQGSYAAALSKGQPTADGSTGINVMEFQSDKGLKERFDKAYVGRVCLPGSAYNIQNYLEMEGVFAIKVTPLGSNCCLLEELEVGFIEDLTKEGETWWNSLFSSIVKWEAGSLDGSRDVWYSIFGVPLHAWCPEFFMALGESWGRFVCLDGNISKGETLDVARILVNTPLSSNISGNVPVSIDGVIHVLCVREDSQYSLRNPSANIKEHASTVDSSDSSESDFERLLGESNSGDSVEMEELDIKEGAKSNSGGSYEKEIPVPCNLSATLSGSFEDVFDGKLSEHREETPERLNPQSTGFETKLVSGNRHPGGNLVLSYETATASGKANFLKPCNFYTSAVSGQQLLKDTVKVDMARVNRIDDFALHSDSNSYSVVVPSQEVNISGRDAISDLHSATSSGGGACPGSDTLAVEQLFDNEKGMAMTSEVKKRDCLSAVSSAPSRTGLNSGLCLDRFEAPDFCSSDSISVSINSGGCLRAGSSRNPGIIVPHSSGRFDVLSGSVVGGAVSNSDHADVGSKDVVIPQQFSNKDVQCGDRGGRKTLQKVSLVLDQHAAGKGRVKDKLCTSGKVKGSLSSFQSGDSLLKCYGEQSEESDIARNNGRQWDMLRREVGDRLREALNALGVVDRVVGYSHRQGSESVSGGRKEISEMLQ